MERGGRKKSKCKKPEWLNIMVIDLESDQQ